MKRTVTLGALAVAGLTAAEAAAILGVEPATLYAYVSRGLLESRPGPDHRSRMYRRQDVERLAQNKRAGRGAARARRRARAPR